MRLALTITMLLFCPGSTCVPEGAVKATVEKGAVDADLNARFKLWGDEISNRVTGNVKDFINGKKITTHLDHVQKAIMNSGTPPWVEVAAISWGAVVFIIVVAMLVIQTRHGAMLRDGRFIRERLTP